MVVLCLVCVCVCVCVAIWMDTTKPYTYKLDEKTWTSLKSTMFSVWAQLKSIRFSFHFRTSAAWNRKRPIDRQFIIIININIEPERRPELNIGANNSKRVPKRPELARSRLPSIGLASRLRGESSDGRRKANKIVNELCFWLKSLRFSWMNWRSSRKKIDREKLDREKLWCWCHSVSVYVSS